MHYTIINNFPRNCVLCFRKSQNLRPNNLYKSYGGVNLLNCLPNRIWLRSLDKVKRENGIWIQKGVGQMGQCRTECAAEAEIQS